MTGVHDVLASLGKGGGDVLNQPPREIVVATLAREVDELRHADRRPNGSRPDRLACRRLQMICVRTGFRSGEHGLPEVARFGAHIDPEFPPQHGLAGFVGPHRPVPLAARGEQLDLQPVGRLLGGIHGQQSIGQHQPSVEVHDAGELFERYDRPAQQPLALGGRPAVEWVASQMEAVEKGSAIDGERRFQLLRGTPGQARFEVLDVDVDRLGRQADGVAPRPDDVQLGPHQVPAEHAERLAQAVA